MTMTREDAIQLLGLDAEHGRGELAHRRYEDLCNDYQVRLANAPTPALKRKYQEMLAQLDAARASLAGDDEDTGDLPSRIPPSIVAREVALPPAPQPAEPPRPSDGASSVPKAVLVALAIASLMAATATLAGLRWFRSSARVTALEQQIAKLDAAQQQLVGDQAHWRALLASGPLQVCNRSSAPLTVTAVMAMYVRPSGQRVYVHSGAFGYPRWTIPPGARARLDIVRGRADDWDGSASVYAVQVASPGNEPFIVSGLWSDLRDGCLNLSLD